MTDAGPVARQVEALYRAESRHVLATLIRLLRDFDLAEEALHDAFLAALEQWPRDGVPARPRAWLVSAGRFRAIDRVRRRARHDARLATLAAQFEAEAHGGAPDAPDDDVPAADDGIADDRLRLIFTCCHPALSAEARVALTLRELCGLTTEEIARAFLVPPATLAQRIVRAKTKIRDARIPYRVPARDELPARLDAVLQVVYLVFTEGYAATAGDAVTRPALSAEAIRLGRLLAELLPEPEVVGLLALMLLHEARRPAREGPGGELVLLDAQDRTRWDRALVAEGLALAERALAVAPRGVRAPGGAVGPYALQAAIAAVHAERADATDWAQIVALYDHLLAVLPTPVVALNRAVAVAMRDGPAVGLALIDALLADAHAGPTLAAHHLTHAARAELCQRVGRTGDARAGYARALALATQAPERRHLARRLAALDERETAAGSNDPCEPGPIPVR